MKKAYIFLMLLFCCITVAKAQSFGINTTAPQTDLDINVDDPTATSTGIAFPQVEVIPPAANMDGQIVFLTATNIFYYSKDGIWIPFESPYNIGQIKDSYQKNDHNGWFLLNGRALADPTLQLSNYQIANAQAQGMTTHLLDASNSMFINQKDTDIGKANGQTETSITLTQANMPAITYNGETDSKSHGHGVKNYITQRSTDPIFQNARKGGNNNPLVSVNHRARNGDVFFGTIQHKHKVFIPEAIDKPIPIQTPYLQTNKFIYLGIN